MNDAPAVKTIDLVYFNAGGGHRAAATALETVIRGERRPWEVRLVNLMKILDPKDVFRKTTGMDWEDLYNTRLRARLERRARAGTEAAAGAHSLEPPLDGQPVAAALAQDPTGHGGLAHSELQSPDVRSARHAHARTRPT